MTSSSKRTLSILLALALFAAAVFVYASLIKPAYSGVVSLRTKVGNLNQTLINYTSLSNDFQSLFAEYQNLSDLENQLSMVLPQKLKLDYAINQMVGLAKNSGLEIKSLSLKESASKLSSVKIAKGIGILKIDLRLTGDYEPFKSLVKKIESNIMISDITSLNIAAGVGDELTYNLSIDAYYQVE